MYCFTSMGHIDLSSVPKDNKQGEPQHLNKILLLILYIDTGD